MDKPDWLQGVKFHPAINLPEDYYVHDFTNGPDPMPDQYQYGIGRYNENRSNLYTAPLFTENQRTVHLGVDIGAPAGEAIYSVHDGQIVGIADHNQPGNYGPTLVIEHLFKGQFLYMLYGHLSQESLSGKTLGQQVAKGETIGTVGSEAVNGGWFPHLHFQLGLSKPAKADMPGVASLDGLQEALREHPDPRWVLGPIYS